MQDRASDRGAARRRKWTDYLRRPDTGPNLFLGVIGGAVGMQIGTLLWVLLTVALDTHIGFVAIGVGVWAGLGVRLLGRGHEPAFGIAAAIWTLVGCLLGNLAIIILVIGREFELGIGQVIDRLDIPIVLELFQITFNPLDLLFYGLAIYAGYQFAVRRSLRNEKGELE